MSHGIPEDEAKPDRSMICIIHLAWKNFLEYAAGYPYRYGNGEYVRSLSYGMRWIFLILVNFYVDEIRLT